jgi:hypothetical protein
MQMAINAIADVTINCYKSMGSRKFGAVMHYA